MSILQNTRFRVAVGVVAVVLAIAAIGAGTYAAFSDTEAGPDGTVAAGTLDLVVGAAPGTVSLFSAANIKPGFSQDVTFQVSNTGSLPGSLSSQLTLSGTDGTCTEPEYVAEGVAAGACAPNGNLQEQMTVAVVSGPGGPDRGAGEPVRQQRSAVGGHPGAGANQAYTLRFALPDLAGTVNNKVQGDTITISSTFNLIQV